GAGTVPVDDHGGLVADHPAVVARAQAGDVTGAGLHLGAVVHQDAEAAAHVVLEVRCLAALGPGDGLDVVGPPPAGLEHQAAHLGAADGDDLGVAVGGFPALVGLLEGLLLDVGLGHGRSVGRPRGSRHRPFGPFSGV